MNNPTQRRNELRTNQNTKAHGLACPLPTPTEPRTAAGWWVQRTFMQADPQPSPARVVGFGPGQWQGLGDWKWNEDLTIAEGLACNDLVCCSPAKRPNWFSSYT